LGEKTILSLARLFVLRHFYSSEEEDLLAIEQLLSPAEQFEVLENRIESLLIRAEALSNYAAKEEIYRVITEEDTYKGTLSYRQTWYYRGMNDYQHATELLEKNPEEAQLLFKRAAASFEQSYQLLKQLDNGLAALSLKHQSQVCFHLGTHESQATAIKVLQKLIDEKDLFEALEEQDEAIYALGLMAAKFYQSEQDIAYAEIAEEALNLTVSLFPDGLFADGALYALGNMYLQSQDYENAQPVFVELAEKYPASTYASEAWFWAGYCSEETDENEENAKHFRQQVYSLYPQSSKAGEAYFRVYSFTDYLQGSKEASDHLQAMLTLFPEDPFIIVAHYLLGIDKKEDRRNAQGQLIQPKAPELALASLKEAQLTFDKLFGKRAIPEEHRDYLITIRYRAMLEHSLLSLSLKNTDLALAYLEEILTDFSQEGHPLASQLLDTDALPRIYEESLFTLSQVYLQADQTEQAEKTLLNMLEKYQALEIPSGYYLSRAWYQLALISMEQGKHEEALRRFDQSEKCGKAGVLTVEQKLDLWIQKSHCYKALKQTHMAMLMLSHVINENVSSSLRIKAMLLRADIYAMQGRHELAIKQLEAASRKGGEWAQTAKEKLKVEYGFK
jgi:TolA-binding protein